MSIEINRRSDRILFAAAVILVSVFALAQVVSIYGGYLWSKPTFRYLSSEFKANNSPLCAGEDLEFDISIWNSGQSRTTVIAGSIRTVGSTIPIYREFEPVWVAGTDTGVEAEITFPYTVTIPPDLPPGKYVYTHKASQLPSGIEQGFEVFFEVIECGA